MMDNKQIAQEEEKKIKKKIILPHDSNREYLAPCFLPVTITGSPCSTQFFHKKRTKTSSNRTKDIEAQRIQLPAVAVQD